MSPIDLLERARRWVGESFGPNPIWLSSLPLSALTAEGSRVRSCPESCVGRGRSTGARPSPRHEPAGGGTGPRLVARPYPRPDSKQTPTAMGSTCAPGALGDSSQARTLTSRTASCYRNPNVLALSAPLTAAERPPQPRGQTCRACPSRRWSVGCELEDQLHLVRNVTGQACSRGPRRPLRWRPATSNDARWPREDLHILDARGAGAALLPRSGEDEPRNRGFVV